MDTREIVNWNLLARMLTESDDYWREEGLIPPQAEEKELLKKKFSTIKED